MIRRISLVVIACVLIGGGVLLFRSYGKPTLKPGWFADARTGCQIDAPIMDEALTFTWSGACVDGKVEGRGQVTWSQDGKPYAVADGAWKAGEQFGHGIMTGPDGLHEEGDWSDGVKNGHFVTTNPRGFRHEGDKHDGLEEGPGTTVFVNGDRYEGNFLEGSRTGIGTYIYHNGDRYEGNFVANQMEGHGVYAYADGRRYDGMWRDGKPDGAGVEIMRDGTRYPDVFRDGQRLLSADGAIYSPRNGLSFTASVRSITDMSTTAVLGAPSNRPGHSLNQTIHRSVESGDGTIAVIDDSGIEESSDSEGPGGTARALAAWLPGRAVTMKYFLVVGTTVPYRRGTGAATAVGSVVSTLDCDDGPLLEFLPLGRKQHANISCTSKIVRDGAVASTGLTGIQLEYRGQSTIQTPLGEVSAHEIHITTDFPTGRLSDTTMWLDEKLGIPVVTETIEAGEDSETQSTYRTEVIKVSK